jgi:hypothetical protein
MSTVAEIKAAIDRLSPDERVELENMVWPVWDRPLSQDEESPPDVREKLAQAAAGRFIPGDRRNIQKIISSLE